jgi:dienelactone hydrolase
MDKNNSADLLKNAGYNFDKDLSNIQSRVYHNPKDNKVLVTFRGTKNLLNDIPTDLAILTGNLKNTQRHRDSKQVYENAKKKYNTNGVTLVGHSMGGSLGNAVGQKNDTIYTFNKGVGFNNPNTKANERAYRTSTDLISVLSAGDKHQHNVSGFNANLLHAHEVDRLNDIKPIYI